MNPEKIYKELMEKIKELGVEDKIKIRKDTIIKIFNILKHPNKNFLSSHNIWVEIKSLKQEHLMRLDKIKQNTELRKFHPACPNCENALIATGLGSGHTVSVTYYICLNCGKCYSSSNVCGFSEDMGKVSYKELAEPCFDQWIE